VAHLRRSRSDPPGAGSGLSGPGPDPGGSLGQLSPGFISAILRSTPATPIGPLRGGSAKQGAMIRTRWCSSTDTSAIPREVACPGPKRGRLRTAAERLIRRGRVQAGSRCSSVTSRGTEPSRRSAALAKVPCKRTENRDVSFRRFDVLAEVEAKALVSAPQSVPGNPNPIPMAGHPGQWASLMASRAAPMAGESDAGQNYDAAHVLREPSPLGIQRSPGAAPGRKGIGMDFKLFLAVVKRYKRVVISGAVLGVVLAVLAYGTPGLKGGKPAIIPRGSEVWQGNAVVLISQAGFPYDRAVQQIIPGKGISIPAQTIGDLSYMSNLSSVYAAMANSDAVEHQVATEAHVPVCAVTTTSTAPPAADPKGTCGSVVASSLQQQGTGSPLPLITLTSSAPTASEAAKLATTTIAVLRSRVTQEQAAAGTPLEQRVQLQTVNSGTPATLAQGHSTSMSILVLFAVMSASIALAFIRNNHSADPVRSTRRRLDEGLGGGLASEGAENGHAPAPDYGLIQAARGGKRLLDRHGAALGTRLTNDGNSAPPRTKPEDASATDARRSWDDRRPPRLLRRAGFQADPRD
jgi:hypothetical protein